MRVMLDNSIFGHSQFAEWAMGSPGPLFGIQDQHYEVLGAVRKKPHDDTAFQAQIDSLPTIGRLIREKRLEAFTYGELRCEKMQQFIGEPMFGAMTGCPIQSCPPAVERSRFYQGDYFAYARKGGKRDRKLGLETTIGQIPFMQMLCGLKEDFLPLWMPFKQALGLTEFEIESLKNLKCFQMLCKISDSAENYPDMFHLWTAQRNHMDAFVTLDSKMANIAMKIRRSSAIPIEYPTEVLQPLELLSILSISEPDPIPIEHGRFYTLHELCSRAPTERFSLFRAYQR